MTLEVPSKYGPITLGFFAVVMFNVWGFAAGTLSVGIYGGGMPILIYGALAIGIMISILCTSFAEFGSAYPSRAGCAMLASKLAGPNWGRCAGYFTGGFHTFGVLFTPPALIAVQTQLFATMGRVLAPSWEPKRWQLFLIYQATSIPTIYCSTFRTSILNIISNAGAFVLVVLLFVVIGLFLGLSEPLASHDFVWGTLINGTGWSEGVGILIGIGGAIYAYGPSHWLLNMADDVEHPRRDIPLAFIVQQVGNVTSLFAFYVASGYAVTDWVALSETLYPSPVGALIEQAIKSRGGTFVILLFLCVPGVVGNIAYVSACLRLVLGFVESGACKSTSLDKNPTETDSLVPFRTWLTKLSSKNQTPISILWIVIGVNFIMSLIFLGSPVGFNILVSSANLFYVLGYIPLFAAYLATGGRYLGREGWFRLPKAVSIVIAAINLAYTIFVAVVLSLPPLYPVTVGTMNWASVLGIASAIFLAAAWVFHARHKFIGYVETVDVQDQAALDIHRDREEVVVLEKPEIDFTTSSL
ncbi:amino acid/polyamine transporter I [Pyrenochaeta sp. MPI-SDFR-AT-0127]|nr:amino acid/polyamine transporter I [Pyrenochaeta sp. MPI-SDFR-AT-0127]